MAAVCRLTLLLLVGGALAAGGCGGGGGGGGVSVTVSSITVTAASSNLAAGATSQLVATAKNSDGSTTNVTSTSTWSSENTAIATVSNSGLVKGVSAGTAQITATVSGVKGTIGLTITSTITVLSPATVAWNSGAFTLTVAGSGFSPDAVVQWSGSPRPTTYISSTKLTAQIPATDTLQAGTDSVAVSEASIGTSNAMTFTIPCVLASPSPASTQKVARLGVYYFDGWSAALTNFHFNGLVSGAFQDREPLSGWRDNTQCAVEQQLAWAHAFGVDFFVFDWYFNTAVYDVPGEDVNSAFKITFALSDRHGMQFAIMYVDDQQFIVPTSAWASTVDQWVRYMSDPGYVRINGKPLLVVYSVNNLEQAFGSSAAVANLFGQLRTAAQAQGLPGVYIVGGLDAGYDVPSQTLSINDLSVAAMDGYDAFSLYTYGNSGVSGLQPFSTLSAGMQQIWAHVAQNSPLPFIPDVPDGWDARPWNEGDIWYARTPTDVSNFVSSAIIWANAHPSLRPEPTAASPLVLMEAWNELGEGSILVPTVGDGTSYGDALAALLTAQPP